MSSLNPKFSQKMGPYQKDECLLGVSGGSDSVALFHLFLFQKLNFGWKFRVAHIHHGGGSPEIQAYRKRAQEFVAALCREHEIPFYTNPPEPTLQMTSEAEFRAYRYQHLETFLKESACAWLALAHHKDDLLETRMLQLTRGAGPQGLESMKVAGPSQRLRPLLGFERGELLRYLEKNNLTWVEDPTNTNTEAFRNWLRNSWLPLLEERRPGSLKSLGRSLEVLAGNNCGLLPTCIENGSLLLEVFYTLGLADQRRVLAQFMKGLGLKNYGFSHINEVLKRLDSPRKELTFHLLKRQWQLDAGRLKVLGLGEIEPDDG